MAVLSCPKCGQANPETGLFCTRCGSALSVHSPDTSTGGDTTSAPAPPSDFGVPGTREYSPAPPSVAVARRAGGFPWLLGCLGVAGIGLVGLLLAVVVVVLIALPKSTTQALGTPDQPVVVQPTTQPAVPTKATGATQPQVVPTQPGGATQPQTGTGQPVAERTVPYMDPSTQFTINYPVGWQIVNDPPTGVTLFYKDSIEGTSFGIAPMNLIPGVLDGQAVIDNITAENTKKNRDYVVTRKSLQPLTGPWQGGGTPEAGYFEASWTNPQGVKVRCAVTFGSRPSAYINTTFFTGIWYQAPVTTWQQMLPTFTVMSKSVKFIGGGSTEDTDKEKLKEALKKLLNE